MRSYERLTKFLNEALDLNSICRCGCRNYQHSDSGPCYDCGCKFFNLEYIPGPVVTGELPERHSEEVDVTKIQNVTDRPARPLYDDWRDGVMKPVEKLNKMLGKMPSGTEQIKDKVIQAVCDDLQKRSEVGIKKYGVTLERTDLKLRDWLQHAYEETLDSANYLKRSIMEIDGTLLPKCAICDTKLNPDVEHKRGSLRVCPLHCTNPMCEECPGD